MAIPNISEAGSQGPNAAAQPAPLAAQPLSILPPIPSASAAASLAGRVTPPPPPYPSRSEFRDSLREWLMGIDGTLEGTNRGRIVGLLLMVHDFPNDRQHVIIEVGSNPPLSFPDAMYALTNVCVLELSGLQFTDIPERLPCRLEELKLTNNALTALSVDRLPNSLAVLDVSHNPDLAKIIPDGRLSQLPNLQRLYASNNRITAIFAHSFPVSLRILDLPHNALSALPDDCFLSLTQIRELNLSHNTLTAFPGNCLPPTARIAPLNLRNNHIESLPLSLAQLPRGQITAAQNPLRVYPFQQLLNAIDTQRKLTNWDCGPNVSFTTNMMVVTTQEEIAFALEHFVSQSERDDHKRWWEAQTQATAITTRDGGLAGGL